MKQANLRAQGIAGYGQYFGLTVGVVKNNSDPMQHGRLQVYIPTFDAIDVNTEDLPWATYVSPFGGATANIKVGPEAEAVPGISAYGFWAIPKNSAQVLIGFIDGNPENRFWVGCIYIPEHNRTLPTGINGVTSEIDESGRYPQQDFPHAQSRLSEAGLWKSDKHFRTRGGYERSVSHPSNKNKNKPTDNGYAPNPLDPSKAESQTISLTTAGRHALIMSDVDEHCRVRLKTANGQQVIFDDTNERIYISTGKGKNWVELDEGNGRIYIYSDSKINIRGKNDINLYSDENINIVANKRVHIKSEERSVHISGKHNVTLTSTHADIWAHASRDIKLKTLDGPKAAPISEELTNTGAPLDKVYRWAEAGGSASSHIELDAGQQLKLHSKHGAFISISDADGVGLNIKVAGSGQVKLSGSTMHHDFASLTWRGGLNTGLKETYHNSSVVPKSGGASAAASYSGHAVLGQPFMGALPIQNHPGQQIKPNHESWDRDEDIAYYPNQPRNAKYQG